MRQKLSSGDSKINKAFDIQIPELSLEAILMGSSEVTAQNIVDLFRVAIRAPNFRFGSVFGSDLAL